MKALILQIDHRNCKIIPLRIEKHIASKWNSPVQDPHCIKCSLCLILEPKNIFQHPPCSMIA